MFFNLILQFYQTLNNTHPHMKVYKKETLPEKYHCKHNERVAPLTLVADDGWLVDYRAVSSKIYNCQHFLHNKRDTCRVQ